MTHTLTRLLLLTGAVGCLTACADAPTTPNARSADPSLRTPSLVKNGSADNGAHPAVILIVMDIDGEPAFRCSGTLVAPKVVVTAGHCVGEPGEFSGIRVFTEENVETGNNNYPFAGPNTIEATSWAAHPQFTEALFFLHDVGVIKLAQPVNLPAGSYGTLPTVNELDALKPSAKTGFTSVGYGLQFINPAHVVEERVRMVATPHLIQINTGFTGSGSLMLSNNASSGGTCFGDSGGPNFLGTSTEIAGVTSFGKNNNCAGTGGVFRLDRRDVVAFLQSQLAP